MSALPIQEKQNSLRVWLFTTKKGTWAGFIKYFTLLILSTQFAKWITLSGLWILWMRWTRCDSSTNVACRQTANNIWLSASIAKRKTICWRTSDGWLISSQIQLCNIRAVVKIISCSLVPQRQRRTSWFAESNREQVARGERRLVSIKIWGQMDSLLYQQHSSRSNEAELAALWMLAYLHRRFLCIAKLCLCWESKSVNQSRGQSFCTKVCAHIGCDQIVCVCQSIHEPNCR